MSLSYDEILSDHSFGQIVMPTGNSTEKSPSTSMANRSDNSIDEKSSLSLTEQFQFSIDELYIMARQFLKGKYTSFEIIAVFDLCSIEKQGSKAIRLKYEENLRFIALSKQATIGKWEASHTQDVGLLDVVGSDRK